MRDTPTQVDGVTELSAAQFNVKEGELESLVTSTGQVLDNAAGPDNDVAMIRKAVADYAATGDFYADSGGVNAYVLSKPSTLLAPHALLDGQCAAFFTTNTNTGACTANVAAFGVRAIRLVGGDPLPAGYIRTDRLNVIRYNSGANYHELEDASTQARITTLETAVAIPITKLDGYGLDNNAVDAVNDLDIAAGLAFDDATGLVRLWLQAALTKKIDVDWVAATNQGGFPSALTLSVDTWYGVFAIVKADGTVDAGFDTSPVAANLLADATDYDDPRLIGFVYYVDGTTGIAPFDQVGDSFLFQTPQESLSDVTLPSTRQSADVLVPSAAGIVAEFSVSVKEVAAASADFYGVYMPPSAATPTPSASKFNIGYNRATGSAANSIVTVPMRVATINAQVDYIWSALVTVSFHKIITHGWVDRRGQA